MSKIFRQLLSVTLCLAMLASFALITPLCVSAADFYKDYTTVKTVKNQLDCYSMQGCDSDDTYIYCTKIKGTEDKAIICRVNKNGEQAVELMNNGDTLAKNTDTMAELAKATAVYGYYAKQYFG